MVRKEMIQYFDGYGNVMKEAFKGLVENSGAV